MSSFYYTGDADSNRRQFIAAVERQRKKIEKNFKDMDIENATARDDIEKEINNILDECDALIAKLEGI